MSIDKTKVEQAFALLEQANALLQSADIPSGDGEEDAVYTIHNSIENTISEIEETLQSVGYYN